MARLPALAAPLLVPLIGLLASCGDGRVPVEEGDLDGLVAGLERDGFVVQQGANTAFFVEDCEGLHSCFGANATSPYALWPLPPAPGADLPPDVVEAPRPSHRGSPRHGSDPPG